MTLSYKIAEEKHFSNRNKYNDFQSLKSSPIKLNSDNLLRKIQQNYVFYKTIVNYYNVCGNWLEFFSNYIILLYEKCIQDNNK